MPRRFLRCRGTPFPTFRRVVLAFLSFGVFSQKAFRPPVPNGGSRESHRRLRYVFRKRIPLRRYRAPFPVSSFSENERRFFPFSCETFLRLRPNRSFTGHIDDRDVSPELVGDGCRTMPFGIVSLRAGLFERRVPFRYFFTKGVLTTWARMGFSRITTAISVPAAAWAASTYPMPIPFFSVGDIVPDVTVPIGVPSAATKA